MQSQVRAAFGDEKVVLHPSPMYAIAEGAAIVAAGLVDKVGTVSRDYCIKLVNDPRHLLIRRGDVDESIGDMWLSLDRDYPKGTEIQINLDLDGKENSLNVHAHLRSDPSVSVSCQFSQGRSDEKMLNEIEAVIPELNEIGLSKLGVSTATEKIAAVVKSANRIVDKNTGEVRPDMRQAAKQELESLKVMMSKERLDAELYINTA